MCLLVQHMRESSERGCSVHYWYPSDDCDNCAIKKSNDKLRKSNSLSLKEFGGCPKHSSYNSDCDLCGMSKLEGNFRFVSDPNNTKQSDHKSLQPANTKEGKSEIQQTNHVLGTNCSVCRRWIKWEKHSVAGAVSGGVTGPFWGAFIGVLVAGPVGATIGLLSGLPAGAYFGGKKDRPKICKSCNDERIGNCIKCSKIMTRGTHDNGGVCISCNRGSD